jgi:hypothetical protein
MTLNESMKRTIPDISESTAAFHYDAVGVDSFFSGSVVVK